MKLACITAVLVVLTLNSCTEAGFPSFWTCLRQCSDSTLKRSALLRCSGRCRRFNSDEYVLKNDVTGDMMTSQKYSDVMGKSYQDAGLSDDERGIKNFPESGALYMNIGREGGGVEDLKHSVHSTNQRQRLAKNSPRIQELEKRSSILMGLELDNLNLEELNDPDNCSLENPNIKSFKISDSKVYRPNLGHESVKRYRPIPRSVPPGRMDPLYPHHLTGIRRSETKPQLSSFVRIGRGSSNLREEDSNIAAENKEDKRGTTYVRIGKSLSEDLPEKARDVQQGGLLDNEDDDDDKRRNLILMLQ